MNISIPDAAIKIVGNSFVSVKLSGTSKHGEKICITNSESEPRVVEKMLQRTRERIEAQPDITLQELKEEFTLPVSIPALCKTIK